MSEARRISSTLLAAAIALATGSALAQQAADAVSGRAAIGVRAVDVDGSTDKYREDVNLDDGARIFDFSASYAPADAGWLDRIDVDVANLGSDPFETMHFVARKYGAYELVLDRRRSEYFYRDTILPEELASIEAATAGDLHRFDFQRVHDKAKLDLELAPATGLNIGIDRYTRSGDSETTLDLEREEFELARPIDESLNAVSIGVEHSWDKVTLVFDRLSRDFENVSRLLLPGTSSDPDPGNPTELDYFFANGVSDYKSRGNLLRLIARPADRVSVTGSWHTESLELSLDEEESAAGIDFNGLPFSSTLVSAGDIDRDIEIADIDVDYRLNDRLAILVEGRRQSLDQHGTLARDGEAGQSEWDMSTTGIRAGLELAATSRLVLSAGLSRESRDVSAASELDTEVFGGGTKTDRDGFFARLRYRSELGIDLRASVEDDDIDAAYTLSSPSASRRYRLQARYRWNNGVGATAAYRRDENRNARSGWQGDSDQLSLRVTYDSARLQLALGIGTIDLSHEIAQLVTAGSRQVLYPIDYRADSDLVDFTARWRVNDRFTIGGSLGEYDNDGSYRLARDDYRAFLEIDLRDAYFLELRYRSIEYREDRYDDYDADLVELAIGLSW